VISLDMLFFGIAADMSARISDITTRTFAATVNR